MMKYVTNHGSEFSNPAYAFVVALLQALTGLAAEIFCIMFLCSLQDVITIIWRYVAYGFIAKIDNIYAERLDDSSKLHKDTEPLVIRHRRRDIEERKEKRTLPNHMARFTYKSLRILYTSFVFYFLPYLSLFLPQLVFRIYY